MSELSGQTGELRATVTITRKATGKVETFELVGHTTPEQHEKMVQEMKQARAEKHANILKENDDGRNP